MFALVDDDVSSTHFAEYEYLGLGTFVETDYSEPDVRYTLIGTAGGNDPDTGDIYRGLDRFGRAKDVYWYDYGASTDAARIKYGYDRASNRIWREDAVAAAQSKPFDELYSRDGLHRLKDMARGTLNAGHTALTSETFAQCWTLDDTGNWAKFQQDDNGNGTWDLKQQRTSNKVNEITDVSETAGPSWLTPEYDVAGNMTTIPQPADPITSFTTTYDAWNRLVKLVDGTNTVQENEYDARRFRTVRKNYGGGTLDETRHFYYTEAWQAIEEREGSSTDAERQHVCGIRYIDDVVLRDRDTDGNGSLDERLYGMQDGNWTVIALCDIAGDVQERYAYAAYGTARFLSPTNADRASSSFNFELLFAGYRLDTPSGLYTVRHRTYGSSLGAWVTRDPARYSQRYGRMNLYAYAANAPAAFVDPSGLSIQPGMLIDPASAVSRVYSAGVNEEALMQSMFSDSDELLQRYAAERALGSMQGRLSVIRGQFRAGIATDANNAFVFNCKCGWIDMGHFWASALAGYNVGAANAYGGGVMVEFHQAGWPSGRAVLQGMLGAVAPGFGGSVKNLGESWHESAWTAEDLNSDLLGSMFGEKLQGKDVSDISDMFEDQLRECNAVPYSEELGTKSVLDSEALKWSGRTREGGTVDPSKVKRYPVYEDPRPVCGEAHEQLCRDDEGNEIDWTDKW